MVPAARDAAAWVLVSSFWPAEVMRYCFAAAYLGRSLIVIENIEGRVMSYVAICETSVIQSQLLSFQGMVGMCGRTYSSGYFAPCWR